MVYSIHRLLDISYCILDLMTVRRSRSWTLGCFKTPFKGMYSHAMKALLGYVGALREWAIVEAHGAWYKG